MKIIPIPVFALVMLLPASSRAQQKPVAAPGTADVEVAPSSGPSVVRGTADTSPEYELRLRVQLLRQKYKLLLERTMLNRTRRELAGRKPDIGEELKETKDLKALAREVEKAEAPLNATIVEEGRASRVSAPSVSAPAVH